MDKQTFIDNMKACGYELRFGRNGNITATKGDATVRFVPLANYIVHIDTPTAIVREGTTDTKTFRRPPDHPAPAAHMRVRVPQGYETCQPFHEGGSNDNDHPNRNHGRQRPMNLPACRTAHHDIINNETKEMR